jgi:hypothetical protein
MPLTPVQNAVEFASRMLEIVPDENRYSGMVELFAEDAIMQAATAHVSGNTVSLDAGSIAHLQGIAHDARNAILNRFREEGYHPVRELRTGIAFVTGTSAMNILVDSSAAGSNVDLMVVRTPYYYATFTNDFVQNNPNVQVNINSGISVFAPQLSPTYVPWTFTNPYIPAVLGASISPQRSYTISFSREVSEPVTISVVSPAQVTPYHTVQNTGTGENVASKRNPVSGNIAARIRSSGTYVVVENRMDFADIQNLSSEMQRAIRVLASQGVVGGMSPTHFAPGQSISRAQIATLYTRMLGIYNANADGGFADVRRGDWFFGAAGTARNHGLMTGTNATNFSPHLSIPKEQLIAISARVLRNQMRFNTPANSTAILQSNFHDYASISAWSRYDIALATRENLVIPRADGNFVPNAAVTRGEAALILYRLHQMLF